MAELQSPEVNPTYTHIRSSQLKMRNKAKKAKNFISRSERVVKDASDRIVDHYQAIQHEWGERPFNQHKLSEIQQLRRYSVVRDNPQGWAALIQQHGLAAAVDYAIRMEKLAKQHPGEADYANPNNAGQPVGTQR